MTNILDYVLNLKDNLSGKLGNANAAAKGLEATLGSVKSALGVLGVGFAVFKGIEFVKEGVEKFHELEQVTAKIGANLKSTGEIAGMSLEDVEGYAKGLSSHILSSRTDVLDMASQLLTFPAITKQVFEQSMGLVADIAAQTHHGLSETAIMFGKAFSDPAKGLNKMIRYGVMLTDQEKEKIIALQQSGKLIAAQEEMMKDIARAGYSGVATAMFNADPLARFNKTMGSLKLTMGEVAIGFLKELTPSLEKFAIWLKKGFEWIKKNKDEIIMWAKALGAAWIAVKSYEILVPILLAIENGLVAAAVGATGFGAAISLAISPVTLLAAAVGVLVLAHEKLAQYDKNKEKYLSDVATDEEDFVQQGMEKYKGLKNARELAMADEQNDINESIAIYKKSLQELNPKNLDDNQIYGILSPEQMDDFFAYTKELEILASRQKGLSALPTAPIKTKARKLGENPLAPQKDEAKATGSKAVTINISINKMIESFKISTTTMGESINSIKEKVAESLLSAVNDSQIVAGI